MTVYAIGDLHLSFKEEISEKNWNSIEEYKPMDCFGERWNKHYKKIHKNWKKIVKEKDIILLPGDFSWAQKLEEVKRDFPYLSLLPGKKVLIKGNHDYWWQSISKVRSQLPANTYAIQNDSINLHNISIAGTRGWVCPNDEEFSEHDQKIFRREKLRLEMSLDSLEKKEDILIVMFHYMPVNKEHEKNELIELLISYDVDICIYGHLHGEDAFDIKLPDNKWGIKFYLVSADFLNFAPQLIYKD